MLPCGKLVGKVTNRPHLVWFFPPSAGLSRLSARLSWLPTALSQQSLVPQHCHFNIQVVFLAWHFCLPHLLQCTFGSAAGSSAGATVHWHFAPYPVHLPVGGQWLVGTSPRHPLQLPSLGCSFARNSWAQANLDGKHHIRGVQREVWRVYIQTNHSPKTERKEGKTHWVAHIWQASPEEEVEESSPRGKRRP